MVYKFAPTHSFNNCVKNYLSMKESLERKFSTLFERWLNVKPDEYYLSDTKNLSDSVEIAIRKFENHPSVQTIK